MYNSYALPCYAVIELHVVPVNYGNKRPTSDALRAWCAKVRGPTAAPSVPRIFRKVRGPPKEVRGPGILWLPCNSNTGSL